MKNGKIHPTDIQNLKQLGDFIKESFSNNLVEEAGITTIPPLDCREMSPEVLRTDDYETYFLNEAGTNKLVDVYKRQMSRMPGPLPIHSLTLIIRKLQ